MLQTANPHHVWFLLYDGVEILDVAGPAEVLAQANAVLGRTVYQIAYFARSDSGQVRSSAHLPLVTQPLPELDARCDTLMVPGAHGPDVVAVTQDQATMRWLTAAAEHAPRLASICSGALVLGAIGALDGHRVTTHWAALDELARRHPRARVARDALHIRDGRLWTSAGVLSGVDMALAMVAEDLGNAVALQVARQLVVFLIRHGGQSQFSGPMDFQTRAHGHAQSRLIGWLQAHLHEPVTVAAMAQASATSVRSLHRRCRESWGLTPAQLLAELRLERARTLLHEPGAPVKRVADQCGFGDAAAFSRAFTRRFGVAPARYRETFAGGASDMNPAMLDVAANAG